MKRKPTDREILEAVTQQVEAMLLFSCVDNGVGKSEAPRPSRFRTREHLKGLIELADLLNGKIDEWPSCEACGKPIKSREAYIHHADDGLSFHARCVGVPAVEACRKETPAYFRRCMTKRAEEARAFLRKKGLVA